eukprot:253091-Amphidinium_carterae.1
MLRDCAYRCSLVRLANGRNQDISIDTVEETAPHQSFKPSRGSELQRKSRPNKTRGIARQQTKASTQSFYFCPN